MFIFLHPSGCVQLIIFSEHPFTTVTWSGIYKTQTLPIALLLPISFSFGLRTIRIFLKSSDYCEFRTGSKTIYKECNSLFWLQSKVEAVVSTPFHIISDKKHCDWTYAVIEGFIKFCLFNASLQFIANHNVLQWIACKGPSSPTTTNQVTSNHSIVPPSQKCTIYSSERHVSSIASINLNLPLLRLLWLWMKPQPTH